MSDYKATKESVSKITSWYGSVGANTPDINSLMEYQEKLLGQMEFIGEKKTTSFYKKSMSEFRHEKEVLEYGKELSLPKDGSKKPSDEVIKKLSRLAAIETYKARLQDESEFYAWRELYSICDKYNEAFRSRISLLKQTMNRNNVS